MRVEIETSGCTERKGLVQVRFAMYLDPGDYGYDVHHIQVPVIPEGGYPGETKRITYRDVMDEDLGLIPVAFDDPAGEATVPIDSDEYDAWYAGLPRVWQTNPFHNHFIYVEPDTPDSEIMDIGEAFLHEAYVKWASDEQLALKNPHIMFPTTFDSRALAAKVLSLKVNRLERGARWVR